MNERIKELAFEAMSINQKVSDDSFFVEVSKLKEFEKFAELIVRECIQVCNKEIAEYVVFRQGTDDFSEKNIYAEGEVAASGIKYKIKHLFGVEE